MIREFNSLEEIENYYDQETNTYIFKENGEHINLVIFNFDLNLDANIEVYNINACDIHVRDINAWNIKANNIYANDINANHINAWNIDAGDINAWNINACDISYWAVCFAYNSIKCKSITSKRENHKHFVLDGKLEVEENEKEN